ncbi:universal stress protein [Paenarthrobacter aurescens]|jgi:nucleotide-binding universal stress UspA family protein|uniref:Universal stress protein n=1 Tax=Paenarthrobacter aurescens TaxID=43663 RepID=A0A4Y3NGK9_PAEAU|nr:universal stress protein [Paenarthrobacter aurescens]UKA49679.1 universal stress protein [Arthrobacter sp. FW305-123]MDO6145357.1 universal stress protein [Paenarthrobacter aurescens]MDO6149162.1 universal stress protein [Paenarthrobacter aurescens]MDO6160406.1 universal stress protein [Paenarthrobacter aurescens]MDO6164265.1 universal stress protein [Paenarthrobacter aurescens]
MTGVVIVGVDGSETAMRAAQAAQQLAIGLGASLRVVSAFDSNRTEVVEIGTDKWIVSDAAEAEAVARAVAERLADDRLEVTYSAARGKPGEALVKEAEVQEARLIVVGNRRMQGLGRVLGSVANTVAHTAPCDVYIAKTDQP